MPVAQRVCEDGLKSFIALGPGGTTSLLCVPPLHRLRPRQPPQIPTLTPRSSLPSDLLHGESGLMSSYHQLCPQHPTCP